MKPFSLLVKPAGADCNMACPYCFYRSKASLHADPHPRMSESLIAHIVESYLEMPMPAHSIAFQGGEPTLMGEDFFRRAAELGAGVEFSIQTNATLVTESFARFLADSGWLVGVSPHDDSREFRRGYRRLVEAGADVRVLQLVTKRNVGEPEQLYSYLADELGCRCHQYIECTWPDEFAVGSDEWGDFMVRIFDEWRRRGDERRVSVRTFDSIVSQLVTGVPSLCQFSNDCRHHLVVEANGDVYPCDFFVRPELKLGNIATDSWEDMANSTAYAEFGARKRGHPDCPRSGHALDEGWRRFYAHAVPHLRRLGIATPSVRSLW